jgi:hypothetical protein
MSRAKGEFTLTQRILVEVLKDGQPHKRADLMEYLPDNLSSSGALRFHICNIRKILKTRGMDIVCVWHRKCWCYRMMRELYDPPKPLESAAGTIPNSCVS